MRDLSGASGIGFTLVAYVLVFTAIGYGLDRLFKTAPWLMVAGVFVGAVLGFIYMIRTLTRAADQAREQKRHKSKRGPGRTTPDRDGRRKLIQIVVSVVVGAWCWLSSITSPRCVPRRGWLSKGKKAFPCCPLRASCFV